MKRSRQNGANEPPSCGKKATPSAPSENTENANNISTSETFEQRISRIETPISIYYPRSNDPNLPPSPKYAMAGMIVFHMANNMEIQIRGDIYHIEERLMAADGYFRPPYNGNDAYYLFSVEKRSNIRKFLSMHDDLPGKNQYVELNLEDIGRRQAAEDGFEITAEEERQADDLYNYIKLQRDQQLLSGARQKLKALGWTDKEDVAAQNRLSTSIDEICFEMRIDFGRLEAKDIKEFLRARGLSDSGNRPALEKRLLTAAANFQQIPELAKYKRFAKQYKHAVRGVYLTRAETLIDSLLARCNQ